ILMNFVINCRDAMPKGGELRVGTKNISLSAADAKTFNLQPNHYVVLTVSDSGHGMTPEIKEKIFDPFFTTKPVGKGTGLGLSTVYGIVQQYQAKIIVDSEVNVGTSFQIYFPVSKEEVLL